MQWRPFQPWEQTQVPFLHCPCSAQRLSHGNWSHRLPVQPALHRHLPFSHTPFRPQSKLQTAAKREGHDIQTLVELVLWAASTPSLLSCAAAAASFVFKKGHTRKDVRWILLYFGENVPHCLFVFSAGGGWWWQVVTKDIRRLLSLQFSSASEWNVCKFISRLRHTIYILLVIYDT